MAELSVQIGADIQDLLKKLQITEKEFKKLALEAAKSGKTIEQVLKDSGKGGKALQQGAVTAAKGMNTLGKSTANAVPTLTSFSQVIQDAPYGIRGVANNITQLTSQFGYLSKSAGGGVAALKLMGSSILGPAGVLFAVSAITSLMVSYDGQLFKSKTASEKLADANKKLRESLDKYIEGLSDVRKAELEGDKSAAKQIINLSVLRSQIEDTSNSQALRLDGIKRLRDEFGGYFKDISDEALLNGQAKTSYDLLTNSIIKRAKATAATNLLVKNAEKELEINEQLKDLQQEIASAVVKTNEEQASSYKAQSNVITGAAGTLASADIKRAEAASNLNDLLEKQTGLIDNLSKIGKTTIELEATIKANEVVIPEDVKPKPTKPDETYAKRKQKLFEQLQKDIDADILESTYKTADGVADIYRDTGAELKDALALSDQLLEIDIKFKNIAEVENRVKELSKLAARLDVEVNLKGLSLSELDEVENKLYAIQDIQRLLDSTGVDIDVNLDGLDTTQLKEFKKDLDNAILSADIFSNAVGSSFSALASEMSAGLSTGNAVVDAFVSSIIGSLAELLTQLVAQQVIQAAIGASALAQEAALGTARSAVAGSLAQTQGVQIATSAAAALGPAGFIALPGLLAATFAQIAGALALAKVGGSFAQGGFTGSGDVRDETGHKVAGVVHDGEYVVPKRVLKQKQGAHLVNQLEGMRKNKKLKPFASGGYVGSENLSFMNNSIAFPVFREMGGLTNNTTNNNLSDGVVGEVLLRGNNQVIQLRRAEKRMSRNFNS